MRLIAKLVDQMCEEVEGAKDYAIEALELKVQDPDLSKYYHSLSQTEYEHAEKLHEFAAKKVEEARNSGYQYPDSMSKRWEEKHRDFILKMKDARVFIDMYR